MVMFTIYGIITTYKQKKLKLKNHINRLKHIFTSPYAPCMVYLPTKLGDFGGKCWKIFHTWSIWNIYIYDYIWNTPLTRVKTQLIMIIIITIIIIIIIYIV
jgi:hypothetical protein